MEEYRVRNEKFVKAAQSSETLNEMRTREEQYIRTMIYDKKPIARTVLNATNTTIAELSKDLNNELFMIVDIQGDKKVAFEVPFTADVATSYINVPQAKFIVHEVDTKEFVKNIFEISLLNHSFSDEIEEHADQAIYKREDQSFLTACDAAVAATGQQHTITPAPGQAYLYKENFVDLINILVSNAERPLRTDTLLMNEVTWNKIQNWNKQEFGDEIGKMTINGMDFNTILGYKVLTTLKSDLVVDNTVYAFTPPENLGSMKILDDITLFMKKEKKDIFYWFNERILAGIANANAVAKLVLP